jgi:hypothetical protein
MVCSVRVNAEASGLVPDACHSVSTKYAGIDTVGPLATSDKFCFGQNSGMQSGNQKQDLYFIPSFANPELLSLQSVATRELD